MLPLRLGPLWLLLGWVGVAAAIVVSLWPGGVSLAVNVWDKLQHALGYFVLALWFTGLYPRERYAHVGGACFALGVAIELLQGLTITRRMDFSDVVANSAGIVAALLCAHALLGGWALKVERLVGLRPRESAGAG